VIDRMRFTTDTALNGPRGDVCPQPATIGTELPRLGRVAASVPGAATGGTQDGRQAFAVDRREVPT
jgi:hypothetical protein